MTLLTSTADALFLEAARDAFAFRALREPEHSDHWHGLVIDAARRLDALAAAPPVPELQARNGEVILGGRRFYMPLGGATLAAQVLEFGQASFADLYPTPGAAREALRRFRNWLDRHGYYDLAEQVWRIRCEADLVAREP